MSARDEARRASYVRGIRALADLLENTPALPIPSTVSGSDINWGFGATSGSPAVEVATVARMLPGKFTKNDPNLSDYDSTYYLLKGSLAGFPVELWAYREAVCEKVITGTEQITKLVADPEAPQVEVTETVEKFEWVCKPILAEVTS